MSYGRTYPGPWQSEQSWQEGFEQPVVFWVPSIAISGMAFYTGDRLPKWKGDVFVGGLRTGEIPGTGHLERILFNEKMEELRRESLLVDLRQRIRDVRQGPDELLYVLTDADDGAVLRIEPAHKFPAWRVGRLGRPKGLRYTSTGSARGLHVAQPFRAAAPHVHSRGPRITCSAAL